jgi:tRNA 5-methylaminomethyl-2-thiouridine biosynthesis bifunctional protein
LWHDTAAWIKPASLVKAWLSQPGIRFQGNSTVASIHRQGRHWDLKSVTGIDIAGADLVVLANAGGAIPLLRGLADTLSDAACGAGAVALLQTLEGQVSWARHRNGDTSEFPPFPVNGLGSLIGHVPIEGGTAWFAGATFEREGDVLDTASGHLANLQRLQTLLPASGRVFTALLQRGDVQAWRNIRCTGTDRMPVCGPLIAGEAGGLWITAALGARGLSLAVLCAELLAARIGGEPWPIEAKLAQSLDSMRKSGLNPRQL